MKENSKRSRVRVTMIVANVKRFRLPFYRQLTSALSDLNIELRVLYSDPDPIEREKRDSVDLEPPVGRKIFRRYLAGNKLLMQFPPIAEILRSDLIVIVQANGYLLNYPLLVMSALKLKKVAFWGHGYNRQGKASSITERVKRALAASVDWWFAYTADTAHYLASIGVDPNKITPIENAIDTRAFRSELASISPDEVGQLRARLGIAHSDRVALYCGSLYEEKKVGFLLEAAEIVARKVDGFRLLVVGAGAESEDVRRAAERSSVISYAGPLFGRDKAVSFRLAEIFLNPGLVGLGILDSFAAGLPLITCADGLHSPEIAYLEHRRNGLLIDGDVAQYSSNVVDLLNDRVNLAVLSQNAKATAERYTVENMVSNVARGVVSAVGAN